MSNPDMDWVLYWESVNHSECKWVNKKSAENKADFLLFYTVAVLGEKDSETSSDIADCVRELALLSV